MPTTSHASLSSTREIPGDFFSTIFDQVVPPSVFTQVYEDAKPRGAGTLADRYMSLFD